MPVAARRTCGSPGAKNADRPRQHQRGTCHATRRLGCRPTIAGARQGARRRLAARGPRRHGHGISRCGCSGLVVAGHPPFLRGRRRPRSAAATCDGRDHPRPGHRRPHARGGPARRYRAGRGRTPAAPQSSHGARPSRLRRPIPPQLRLAGGRHRVTRLRAGAAAGEKGGFAGRGFQPRRGHGPRRGAQAGGRPADRKEGRRLGRHDRRQRGLAARRAGGASAPGKDRVRVQGPGAWCLPGEDSGLVLPAPVRREGERQHEATGRRRRALRPDRRRTDEQPGGGQGQLRCGLRGGPVPHSAGTRQGQSVPGTGRSPRAGVA